MLTQMIASITHEKYETNLSCCRFCGLICYSNKKTRIFDGKIRVLCYVYYVIKTCSTSTFFTFEELNVKHLRVGLLTIGSS